MEEREEENEEENEYEYIDFGPEEEGTTMKIFFKNSIFYWILK